IGVTPLTTTKLVEGSYRVTLKLEGYKDWSTSVNIPEQSEITVELVAWGSLTVRSDPAGANLYLDDQLLGETVAQGTVLHLEGEHRLKVVSCGYRPWSTDVTVASGEAQELRAELERITAVLIETDPPGAEILVDGRYVGKTPATVAIEPSLGELTLTKEGYKPWSTTCITEGEIHVLLRKNEPPVARISGPDGASALEELRFSASGSTDPDGEIVSYHWDFGDGATAYKETVWHGYQTPGTYQVKLTVVDDDGAEGEATKEITIESHPPVVQISGPISGKVGEELTFSGEGSHDPDGKIVAYHWDFGDGSTASGMIVSHRFEKPGFHMVVLVVVDDCDLEAVDILDVKIFTQFGLILDQIQGLIEPVPYNLDLDLGRGESGWSLGLLIGDDLRLGGSISFTGEEVPDYYEISPQSWDGEVYNLGPELELCALSGTTFIAGVSIECGIGISFQQRVHIATMPSSQGGTELLPQRAVILPNGYTDWETYLNTFAGISIRLEGAMLSLRYHNRRGWIVGIGVEF
ncbi:MAG: PKD domain-containing protein, partial [Caldisericota bacterium]|nr:PKD domain-containing protein [Caldisericota bacterium]